MISWVPFDLKRPVRPSRGQIVLAHDGQPLSVRFGIPERHISASLVEFLHPGLDIDGMPRFEEFLVELDLGDGDLVDALNGALRVRRDACRGGKRVGCIEAIAR